MQLLVLALTGYAAIAVFAHLVADRMIFLPPAPSYESGSFPFHRVPVDGEGSLVVVHLPNDTARYTILYSHGNAEDLGHVLPFLGFLRDLGFGVIGYDYRGYGQSRPGPPTTRKVSRDADAAYRYAVDHLNVRPERLIVAGTSVGAGPAVELAAVHQPAGLVIQSAFTSAFRVMTRVALLPFDRFPNLRRIRTVEIPVLVIHGTRDSIIPWSHGRRLFAEAPGPKRSFWVEGADHNDLLLVAGARYGEALREFVELLEGR